MNTVQKNNNITNGSMSRKINNMPRKALGYRTPLEVFENNLKKKGIDTSFLDIYRIKLPKCLAA